MLTIHTDYAHYSIVFLDDQIDEKLQYLIQFKFDSVGFEKDWIVIEYADNNKHDHARIPRERILYILTEYKD